MTTSSSFGSILPAQNGMGNNAGVYELGGDLVRPTVVNTSPVNTLALTGLTEGDPATAIVVVIDPAGVIHYMPFASFPDFWRNALTGLPPDGVTDTIDPIRHRGHVGVGGATDTDAMPVVLTPVGTNNFLHLSPVLAGRGQIMYGTNPHLYYTTRTVPVVLNDYVEICSWTSGSQASVFTLTVNVSDGGFAVSKYCVAAVDWHATANAWRVLKPLSDGGAFNGNNYEVLINVNNGVVTLRLRRIAGATAGTFRIYLQFYNDPTTMSVTELVAVGNDPGVYASLDPFGFGGGDFFRSANGTLLPDNSNDTTELVGRMGPTTFGTYTQVGTSQVSVVSDTNAVTDPIASFQANNLTQGVDITWTGIQKSGTAPNSSMSINAKGSGHLILQAAISGEPDPTGFVGVNIPAPGNPAAMFDVNGAGVFRPVALGNHAANGVLGANAGATVDIASFATLPQTTPNIQLTIANPTNLQAGRIFSLVNTGTVQVKVSSQYISPGQGASWEFTGAIWAPIGEQPDFLNVGANRNVNIGDHLKTILAANAVTLTVQANTAQYMIFRIRQSSNAGVITIAAGAGVTLVAPFGAATIGLNGDCKIVEVIGNTVYVS